MTVSSPNKHHKSYWHYSVTVPSLSPMQKSQGIATLVVATILLLVALLLVISVSRVMIVEQRTVSNEIRHRQAFEAAEAGLNAARDFFIKQGTDPTLTTVVLPNGAYHVRFCEPGTAASVSCPDTPAQPVCTGATAINTNRPLVAACGWSDDGLGRVRIIQDARPVGGLGKVPTNPLIAGGAVNVGGSATVTNFYNNLTIWSGDAITSVGNAGKTFVRNPLVEPPQSSFPPPAPPTACSTSADYVCLTDKNNTGPDVIDEDPTLKNVDMFKNLTGMSSLAEYIDKVGPLEVSPSSTSTLNGVLGKAIVIDGTVSANMNFTIGSREQPVVLIITGNWTGGGNTTVHGVVYVAGDIDLNGTKTVLGSLVVGGTVAGTGSLDIIYDPFAVDNAAENTGQISLTPGTWRDWN